MKPVKPIKSLSLMLVASLLLSVPACQKKTSKTKSSEKESSTSTEESDSQLENQTTSEPSETPEDTTSDPETSDGLGLLIDVPAKNCSIEIPQDERYHYFMDITLNPKENTIGGHVDVTFFNNSDDDWDQICLRDYSSLFTDNSLVGYDGALKLNGAMTAINNITDSRTNNTITYTRDEDISVVWLPLEEVLAPGEEMTLSYDFVATVPEVADRYGVQDGIYCVSNFYPMLSVYTDEGWSHEAYYECGECFFYELADFDVYLTLPENMQMVSTGLEMHVTPFDGQIMYSLYAECVRSFVFCASENFEFLIDQYKDTEIRVVYDPASCDNPDGSRVLAEESLKVAKDSLAAFGSAFGEYPYRELEVVIAPIAAGGMEYPNLVMITAPMVDPNQSAEEIRSFMENIAQDVVSHEIGHQWFMGIVGNNSGLEPWLDESFASYTEVVYRDYLGLDRRPTPIRLGTNGSGFLNDEYVKFAQTDGVVPINRSYYDFPDQYTYLDAVYTEGQLALCDMEEIIGRENFYGVIREYVQRNAFTNSTEDRFFEVLYECVGTDNEDLNEVIEVVFGR